MSRRLLAAVTVLMAVLSLLPAAAGAGEPVVCDRVPDPSRWSNPAEPDAAPDDVLIAVHRGAAELAPENTLAAFEAALAYDVEMIEVDVQQTLDHRYVAFHDLDVARRTGASGTFPLLTFDQARALNVANNDRWRGSDHDPSRMPSLEEVLALADEHGAGIMFDLKESVTDAATVANMAAAHDGLLERSVFIPYVPGRAEMIKAAQPTARLNFSNQLGDLPGGAPPGTLYAMTAEYWSFGSSLPSFDAGDVAEIHDGCGLVVPNVYQGHVTGSEAGDLRHALSIGADGAQVNNPDVAVEVLGRPVATALVRSGGDVCLVNVGNRLGLPAKTLTAGGHRLETGRAGCVALPGGYRGSVSFPGDGSALGSTMKAGR